RRRPPRFPAPPHRPRARRLPRRHPRRPRPRRLPSSFVAIWAGRAMRAAVIGHVEWIEFARVERVPVAGEIVHALEAWEEPGGGGSVAAVQLSKLAEEVTFF